MKIHFLGTGTSTGIPQIGCSCDVCKSKDSRDKRLRSSILLEEKGTRILIDCGPDVRTQMLPLPFIPIDAVLLTHEHYDHVGGLDDLRPFCKFHTIKIYAPEDCCLHLRERMPYCFAKALYAGAPKIEVISPPLHEPFLIGSFSIIPFRVMHGHLPIFGYRINDLVYITDMSVLPSKELAFVKGAKILIVNALRIMPHPTHQSLSEAIAFAQEIGADTTFFTHISHQLGTHYSVSKNLPAHIYLAYDGLELSF